MLKGYFILKFFKVSYLKFSNIVIDGLLINLYWFILMEFIYYNFFFKEY